MTLIIQNGLIVDGSGKPGFCGDIVIDGDKIVEVTGNGERIPRAKRVAEGDALAGVGMGNGVLNAEAS